MPAIPCKGLSASHRSTRHAISVQTIQRISPNRHIGPTLLPLHSPALSPFSFWQSNGLPADSRREDHAPWFVKGCLNGVLRIVRLMTRYALVSATPAATSVCDGMWKVRLPGAGAHADRESTAQCPHFLCCTVPAALFQ